MYTFPNDLTVSLKLMKMFKNKKYLETNKVKRQCLTSNPRLPGMKRGEINERETGFQLWNE